MDQLEYFTKESGTYKFKPKIAFKIIMSILLLGVVIAGYTTKVPAFSWLFGILLVMIVVTIFTDKFEIDTNRKMIVLRQGIYMQSRSVPFDKIVGFEMFTTSVNLVRSSVALNLYYENEKGKEKVIKVAQSMSKKHIQKIMNEVDDILEHNGYQTKI